MKIEIKDIRKSDYKKAIQFAVKGMHFDWYLNNPFFLNAYGRYFWYQELNRATQIFAAYVKGEFAGVLLAEIRGEKKQRQNIFQKIYVKIVDIIQEIFFGDSAGRYQNAAGEQLTQYLKRHTPDGELLFLAADPDCGIRGIGTALLHALEEKEKGKTVYLFTDDACTYQFYEHRGFLRTEERKIVLELPRGKVPLRLFIYHKTIP